MEKSAGVVYVAWGDQYINEAICSAKSVKQNAKLSTCLLTDKLDNSLNQYFDIVKFVNFGNIKYHQYMRKWICLTESPFEISCYLDTDTFVIQDLSLGIEMTERYGVSTIIANGMTFHHKNKEYVHYNGGVLFFNSNIGKKIKDEIDNAYIQVTSEKHVGDEAAISVAFVNLNLNPFVLPSIFNTVRGCIMHDRKIRIWHSREKPILTKIQSDQTGNDIAK